MKYTKNNISYAGDIIVLEKILLYIPIGIISRLSHSHEVIYNILPVFLFNAIKIQQAFILIVNIVIISCSTDETLTY